LVGSKVYAFGPTVQGGTITAIYADRSEAIVRFTQFYNHTWVDAPPKVHNRWSRFASGGYYKIGRRLDQEAANHSSETWGVEALYGEVQIPSLPPNTQVFWITEGEGSRRQYFFGKLLSVLQQGRKLRFLVEIEAIETVSRDGYLESQNEAFEKYEFVDNLHPHIMSSGSGQRVSWRELMGTIVRSYHHNISLVSVSSIGGRPTVGAKQRLLPTSDLVFLSNDLISSEN
jgi:hypothetical protein